MIGIKYINKSGREYDVINLVKQMKYITYKHGGANLIRSRSFHKSFDLIAIKILQI